MDQLSRLARSAAEGDHDALDQFVRATYDQVWRFCATFAVPTRADDLAQDTYLRAVRSLPKYRGDSSALTWLLGVARHACLDELRTRTRLLRDDTVAAGRRPVAADQSEQVALSELVNRLELPRREAFALTQILGLSYHEAAQVAECPIGTIRSRVARAREDLLSMTTEVLGDGRSA